MPYPLIREDSFPPGRNSQCFCGSGSRFKRCCGARFAERSIHWQTREKKRSAT